VQFQPARQFLELVIVFAHGRARLQPAGFRLPRAQVNLDELRRGRHEVTLYDAALPAQGSCHPAWTLKGVQVSEQVGELLLVQHLSIARHLAAAIPDNVAGAIVVCR